MGSIVDVRGILLNLPLGPQEGGRHVTHCPYHAWLDFIYCCFVIVESCGEWHLLHLGHMYGH